MGGKICKRKQKGTVLEDAGRIGRESIKEFYYEEGMISNNSSSSNID